MVSSSSLMVLAILSIQEVHLESFDGLEVSQQHASTV